MRFRPFRQWSPLRQAGVVGMLAMLMVTAGLCGYSVGIGMLFAGGQLIADNDWQSVTVNYDETQQITVAVQDTHPVYHRYRVRVGVPDGRPLHELRRQPFGDWTPMHLYAVRVQFHDGQRDDVLRLANGLNDHWYRFGCDCMVFETDFAPLSAAVWLGHIALTDDGFTFVARPTAAE